MKKVTTGLRSIQKVRHSMYRTCTCENITDHAKIKDADIEWTVIVCG